MLHDLGHNRYLRACDDAGFGDFGGLQVVIDRLQVDPQAYRFWAEVFAQAVPRDCQRLMDRQRGSGYLVFDCRWDC